VVDIAALECRDPIEDVIAINRELEHYSAALASRPQIIVANKSDLVDLESEEVKRFEAFVDENEWELVYVSAATGDGLKEMIHLTAERLALLPPVAVFESEVAAETESRTPDASDITIRFEKGKYIVEGEWIYNLMGRINFDDYESLGYFQRTLASGGVFERLEKEGCRDGDTVSIYDFEFDYVK
jgi:GTP-binding protein